MDIWVQLGRYSLFETERCYLRPFCYSDMPDFYKITSEQSNLQFIFQPKSDNESEYLAIHSFMKNPLGVWAIVDKTSQHMLGVIRFERLDVKKEFAEIGYFLHRDYWGRGYMTEILKALINLSFTKFGLSVLRILTHKENVASQRVAEKSGFKLIKQFKGSDRYTHRMRNYLIFQCQKGHFYE